MSDGVAKKPNRELMPFFKRFGPEFDSFKPRGTQIIKAPVGRFVGGFTIEPHWKGQRYITIYTHPLYDPSEYITICGWRLSKQLPQPGTIFELLGSDEDANIAINAMREQGFPALTRMFDCANFYRFLRDEKFYTPYITKAMRLGFTATLLGEPELALEHLDGLLTQARSLGHWAKEGEEGGPAERDFAAKARKETQIIIDHLHEDNLPAAVAQLETWQEESIDRFGIRDLVLTTATKGTE